MGLLGQLAGSLLGGNSQGGNLAGALFQLIQNQPGGLAGLVQGFQNKGLGEVVNSWVGTGQNMPISPDQVQQGLGFDTISQIAQQLGVSPQTASSGLSQLLPGVVDGLTPQGAVPEHGDLVSNGLSMIQSLLR